MVGEPVVENQLITQKIAEVRLTGHRNVDETWNKHVSENSKVATR